MSFAGALQERTEIYFKDLRGLFTEVPKHTSHDMLKAKVSNGWGEEGIDYAKDCRTRMPCAYACLIMAQNPFVRTMPGIDSLTCLS